MGSLFVLFRYFVVVVVIVPVMCLSDLPAGVWFRGYFFVLFAQLVLFSSTVLRRAPDLQA